MGGMYESGYARGVLRVLGRHPAVAWPGDLSASSTYLADDLVEDAPASTGDGGALRIALPLGPGLGPAPDPDRLARVVRERRVVDLGG
jgi:hypothetical protein